MLKRNDDGQAAKEFYEKRRAWAEYACTHAELSDRAFRVGFWLSRRMNGDDQCCWYSIPRIAREMERSPRYVRYAVAELRDAGVMLVVEQKGKPNTYLLRAPFF
ncbi:hypothetical protein DYI37_03310 [Fulvimarina endophytica]|uniref:Helix-turn-helix domain-containing protein n=1 Tax=Fulvimarina endophytica TaxID=2293836 RepID=A0A371XBQ8_9HYPH|nr:helix-turn-helix domain-containing protein [Fulvimarina endophytica]RFC66484.1 hypothetical protein DYI37_03310 [Fulvimarina endophytica]